MSVRGAATIALLVLALAVAACGGDDDGEPERTEPPPTAERTQPERTQERPRLARSEGGPEVETFVEGLEVPWELVFLPDGRALVTERPGRVRLIDQDGELRDEPVAEIEVTAQGEGGLLGMALDPDFEDNRFVYLYFTAGANMKVARYRFAGGRLQEEATILDDIVAGPIHDSGRIAFGPDDRLYIATGDAGQPQLAQEEQSLNGKFLRMDPDQYRAAGGRPEIVSLGHRNPQGLDWEPRTDRLIATEHGATGNDEVNEIENGRNYGWPVVQGRQHGRFTAPLVVYEQTIAPSGASFVTLPGSEWTGDFLIAALAGEQIRRLRLAGDRATVNEPLFEARFGRMRTVVEGPDGALYALTSNLDGRGEPRAGDDRVLRIVPPAD